VVACDSRRARDGRFIEKVGYYNPLTNPAEVKLEVNRIEDWISKGARLSDTVALLLKRFRIGSGVVEMRGSSRGVETT
jgi:small subunit ribosomal protein S16